MTVSPDGRSAYVASRFSSAVAVFDRLRNGKLVQKPGTSGCISYTGAGPLRPRDGLSGVTFVTISPDGQSAYVASSTSDAVAVFDRASDGSLVQKPGLAGCISSNGAVGCVGGAGLDGAEWVAVSPDGRNAYVASDGSGAVAVFDRAGDGTLTQKPGTAGCISSNGVGPCVNGKAVRFPESVAVSPDGQSVYVASGNSDAVAVFNRAANGTLAQKPGTAACIKQGNGAGRCADGEGLDGASSVAVSPDGQHVYTTATISDAVALFDREPSRSRRRRR